MHWRRQGWTIPSTAATASGSAQVQLQDRSRYRQNPEDGRLPYHDTGEVAESGLCGLREHPHGTDG